MDYFYIHRVMIWRQKKGGHQRIIFLVSGYCYPEVKNIFMNISAKTQIFWKIFKDIPRGNRYYWFMQKTRHKKSHATVPLTTTLCQSHRHNCRLSFGNIVTGPFFTRKIIWNHVFLWKYYSLQIFFNIIELPVNDCRLKLWNFMIK